MDFDKRVGWNKRGGWNILMKSINEEGGFFLRDESSQKKPIFTLHLY